MENSTRSTKIDQPSLIYEKTQRSHLCHDRWRSGWYTECSYPLWWKRVLRCDVVSEDEIDEKGDVEDVIVSDVDLSQLLHWHLREISTCYYVQDSWIDKMGQSQRYCTDLSPLLNSVPVWRRGVGENQGGVRKGERMGLKHIVWTFQRINNIISKVTIYTYF